MKLGKKKTTTATAAKQKVIEKWQTTQNDAWLYSERAAFKYSWTVNICDETINAISYELHVKHFFNHKKVTRNGFRTSTIVLCAFSLCVCVCMSFGKFWKTPRSTHKHIASLDSRRWKRYALKVVFLQLKCNWIEHIWINYSILANASTYPGACSQSQVAFFEYPFQMPLFGIARKEIRIIHA